MWRMKRAVRYTLAGDAEAPSGRAAVEALLFGGHLGVPGTLPDGRGSVRRSCLSPARVAARVHRSYGGGVRCALAVWWR